MAYVLRTRERPRVHVAETRVERYTPAIELRSRLSTALKEAWSSPEGIEVATALSLSAREYADALRNEFRTRGIADLMKEIARRYRIGETYKEIWGKR